MHSTGSMKSWSTASNPGRPSSYCVSFFGWMQSTGHASTHAVSFVPMQGSAMTYVMNHLHRLSRYAFRKMNSTSLRGKLGTIMAENCQGQVTDFALLDRGFFGSCGSQILRSGACLFCLRVTKIGGSLAPFLCPDPLGLSDFWSALIKASNLIQRVSLSAGHWLHGSRRRPHCPRKRSHQRPIRQRRDNR